MGDTHGKLLVVNLFILPGKTATGYPDTILNTLRNKTGLDASASTSASASKSLALEGIWPRVFPLLRTRKCETRTL